MLGALWLLDGALQLQPFMFGRGFPDDVLRGAAEGQNALVRTPVDAIATVVTHAPVLTNTVFALTQLALGLALILRPRARTALGASAVWGLFVWWLGEGLGGLFASGSMFITGAPGSALLYAAASLLLWPRTDSRRRRNRAASVWAALWVGAALVQLLPGRNDGRTAASAIA